MSEKVIIRSATVDRHGDYTTVEMLKDYANAVNGDLKMRYLANHRRDIPPMGYFDEAELKQVDGIHHVLVLPIEYDKIDPVEWDDSLVMNSQNISIPLLSRNTEKPGEHITFSVDKNNFQNISDLNITGGQINRAFEGKVALQLDMRKELFPDPRIVITLAPYAVILYPLVKPFLKKMGEKISEDIADDIYKKLKSEGKKLLSRISLSVQLTRGKMIPADKTLLIIFEIPGDPYIELHIRSDDPTKVEKGLQPAKLASVHQKVSDLQRYVDISEIYFILNNKNKWEFSYLLTIDGKVIGTKIAFKKRDKLVTRINLSPTKAFSVGASGVVYERRRLPSPDSENLSGLENV
ncbi:hypothetical protein [Mucilaginibacter pocheonensis]|uniref:Uncharacterized protein n=1 Tax=Mucilaginibacter pocheonensis TaxID=398050 RepID=A0ABU1TEC4_9SPHI|nr:hypothetical protein [Mucilaginibacter pocheonensis]MDR6943703.1 hypothetical protein [Mucilaginibacter pocheonensis]